ncbi:HEAT repeat domain-containing protein [Candidatus Similichlamydia epinepheli]|uniref:HEAT repeat domain-containing protein n=1 Tax=Candidatus Similichlamydia epinepheli TaxID=1903953 RepID=UPI0013008534|nr:HEAT repeat domain-containing protein [Candidatus Similichlamydia epinepheli]
MQNLTNQHLLAVDESDCTILMHRDAHFGGSFREMIDYYEKDGKGGHPDISIERILRLQALEREFKGDLCDLLLSPHQKRDIQHAQRAYSLLRSSYEKVSEDPVPALIADLLLSEEVEPENEIQAILAVGSKAVTSLIALFESEQFHSSLFPGYGFGPELAARCLGGIGDSRAIIPLFQGMGNSDFFTEDAIVEALKGIGRESETFLLRLLQSKPFTEENEHAALALIYFRDRFEVARIAMEMLLSGEWNEHLSLCNYLVMIAGGLVGTHLEHQLEQLAKMDNLPPLLRQDLKNIHER